MSLVNELSALVEKNSRLICGIMSGTSADSIDLAFCRIEGSGLPNGAESGAQVSLEHFSEQKMPAELAAQIRRSHELGVREIAELDIRIADTFARAFGASRQEAGLDVDFIASHGQTVYHHSRQVDVERASLQLGNGGRLALKTNMPVVYDFRTKDIAAGGEGAPLTPYADLLLYHSPSKRRAVLNLGGIANITILDSDPGAVIGFDTGPANAPLDRLARQISEGELEFDVDGAMAGRGKINEALLERLLAEDAYLKAAPPKSTGFEMYGDAFVARVKELHGRLDCDLMTTILAFVVKSIRLAVQQCVPGSSGIDEIIVAGGGSQNPVLMRSLLEAFHPTSVIVSDEVGIPAAAREAMAFAILGNDALFGLPTSLPSVTGAKEAVSLGSWAFPG